MRKLVHVSAAFAPPLGWFLIGRAASLAVLAFVLAYVVLGSLVERRGTYVPILFEFLQMARRPTERFPVAPVEFLLSFLILGLAFREPVYFAAIAVLAFGDGAAAIVGLLIGRHPLPWNRRKSVEGTLAGVLAGAAAALGFDRIGRFVHAAGFATAPLVQLEWWAFAALLLVAFGLVLLFLRRVIRTPGVASPPSLRGSPWPLVLLASAVAAVGCLVILRDWAMTSPPLDLGMGDGAVLAICLAAALCMLMESVLSRHDNVVLPATYVLASAALSSILR